MTVKENLMLVAMEEANELSKELSKSMRFGLDNYHPEKPDETNEVKLLTEFYQLVAMIEHLQDMGYISRFDEKEIDKIKIEKIQKVYYYMDVSKQFGFIDNKEEQKCLK